MYSDILGGLVRIGRVSSVDKEKRTARVIFEDHDDLVSGELKVLQNHPTIAVTKKVDGDKWDYEAQYATYPRDLGLGESYKKSIPDNIKLEKEIEYYKTETDPSCTYTGLLEKKNTRRSSKCTHAALHRAACGMSLSADLERRWVCIGGL